MTLDQVSTFKNSLNPLSPPTFLNKLTFPTRKNPNFKKLIFRATTLP